MVTRAVLRYIRISPRKFRLVIPLVKGKKAEDAIAILMSVKKRGAEYAIDLLKSAMANAKRKQGIDVTNLYISKLVADHGPMLKRFRAASMGRASMIHKHTSHLTLELDELKTAQAAPEKSKGKEAVHAVKGAAKPKEAKPAKKEKAREEDKHTAAKKGKG